MLRRVLFLLLVGACAPPDDRPDVVLVLLDTLRPDHLESYGYEHATSPWLRALGERGIVFDNAFSTSGWTPPSTASALTGLYPTNHGVVHGFETNERMQRELDAGREPSIPLVRLPSGTPTLAEAFRAAGYRTFGATTNVHISEPIGFHRGFEHFRHAKDADSDWVTGLVDEWLPAWSADTPRFLYLHLNDVHRPYDPREPWVREELPDAEAPLALDVAHYDSEIRHVDENLRAPSERLGWDDDTIVCVISDHGEAFGEHGLVGHGPSLHFAVNRVCFLLSGPGVPAGRRDANVSLVDVLPTLLDLAGVPAPRELDGRSLRPLLDEREWSERTLWAHRRKRGVDVQEFLWAAIRGRWKLIHDPDGDAPVLYDLAADPEELRDVAGEHADVVDELVRARAAFLEARRDLGSESVEVGVTSELAEHLRAVGYAGEDE